MVRVFYFNHKSWISSNSQKIKYLGKSSPETPITTFCRQESCCFKAEKKLDQNENFIESRESHQSQNLDISCVSMSSLIFSSEDEEQKPKEPEKAKITEPRECNLLVRTENVLNETPIVIGANVGKIPRIKRMKEGITKKTKSTTGGFLSLFRNISFRKNLKNFSPYINKE